MRHSVLIVGLLIVIAVSFAAADCSASNWPVWPDSTGWPISAVYGLYHWGATGAYMHSGIDINVPIYTPVVAIDSGWVKVVTSPSGTFTGWRMVVVDTLDEAEREGYMYAHMDAGSFRFTEGQWVNAGDTLGVTCAWDVRADVVPHLHLSRVRYAGSSSEWESNYDYWEYVANPLEFLEPICYDPDPPVLENALGEQLLAFCTNESDSYFLEGEPVAGDVDIVCHTYDYAYAYHWKNVPYMIEYKIEGDSSIDWTVATCFTDPFGTYGAPMTVYNSVVYQDDATCNTFFDAWGDQDFYFNLSNTDGDTLVEATDKALCWQTANFHNGDYKVVVKVSDLGGNVTIDSMTVALVNSFAVAGSVVLADSNPVRSGARVTIEPDGISDTTDASGQYSFEGVGGGVQTITISRPGYESADTTLTITEGLQFDAILEPGGYVCGDIDGDWEIPNITDLTYFVEYFFDGGPPPFVTTAADVDGSTQIDVSDLTFLVDYLFGGGPGPICEP